MNKAVLYILLFMSFQVTFGNDKPEQTYNVLKTKTYRKIQAEKFTLFFSGVSVHEARLLVEEGSSFLHNLERDWAFTLVNPKITISLNKQNKGEPIESGYDGKSKSGFLRIPRFDENAQHHFKRTLMTCLLSQNKTPLPSFLQDGLCSYFSGDTIPDIGLLATYGLIRHPAVNTFLLEKNAKGRDQISYQVFSYLFVEKMWEDKRESSIQFLQAYLKGHNLDNALSQSGLGSIQILLKNFSFWARATYKISRIPAYPGFWKLFITIVLFLVFVYHIWVSWLRSGLIYEVLEPETAVPQNLFVGPVFNEPQTGETANRVKEKQKTIHAHTISLDDELISKEGNEATRKDPESSDLKNAEKIIERDLDAFFDRNVTKKQNKKHSENVFKELDERLDRLFKE
ncbi:MAG: hypothetical protein CR997_07610 [Acidobacteria bacterium]|nr:MAG: hypothetical protein CR997_07610 [Acidobacteriota bacterium]